MIKNSILNVTFDTNTLNSVLYPESSQRENNGEAEIVRSSIISGRLRGFFCETLITLEGITKCDRPSVMGSTHIDIKTHQTDSQNVGIRIGIGFTPPTININHMSRINDALSLKILPLSTGMEMGNFHSDGKIYPLYRPDGGITELVRCMDKVHELSKNLGCKGVGKAAAIELGVKLTKKYGSGKDELFHRGLGRAETKAERDSVAKVVAEWADGDSIAAHYGFGMDLFCSEDFGRSSKKASVLDEDHRRWLKSDFDIGFVTLIDLARMLTE
ncbi:hypothetical protein [Komagataeibacter rhaeticus]|uniref:hypothetical protein n=1 Tax=Komagataeibacter rhaeticus TaxID=215221 RepID=UPI001F0A726D|nr:hypothetical protein [Komagataeibacter rhaeticus]